MALIRCPECDKEISDSAKVCPNCGHAFSEKKPANPYSKSKLLSAFIINIIAFVLPIVMVITGKYIDTYKKATEPSPSSDTIVLISIHPEVSEKGIIIAAVIGCVIFVTGIIIFFIKSGKIKMVLSICYLAMAIINLVIFFISTCFFVVSTCFLGIVIYVPGILQICAGAKYISGAKNYEN